MHPQCTWVEHSVGCGEPGAHDEVGTDGSIWARLCAQHHAELDRAIAAWAGGGGPAGILSAWIRARGGPSGEAARKDAAAASDGIAVLMGVVSKARRR